MRSPLVLVSSLLLISGAGAVKAHVYAGRAAQSPASTSAPLAPEPIASPSGHAASVLTASPILASGAQPILRGIFLVEGGYGRAYLEDPRTGTITAYALGDTVGDSRIERIQEDRVVLQRGNELVQLRLGAQGTAMPSKGGEADIPAPRPAAPTGVSPSSGQSSAIRSGAGDATIISNGQPWLDRLGIPQGALSRAIETALPGQESNNLED
jgi:hypothetical protein